MSKIKGDWKRISIKTPRFILLYNANPLPSLPGVTVATVLLPFWFGMVAARFFSGSLKDLSQDNLRRRSLKGPRSAATADLRIHLVWVLVYLLWQFTFGLHVGVSTAIA